MKQSKQRASKDSQPGYPKLAEAKVQRRDFLALLGGGAALALLNACGPGGWTNTNTNDMPIAGKIQRPPFFDLRLPQQDAHTTYLNDQSYLSYVLWAQYENSLFTAYVQQNNAALLKEIDQKLSQYNYGDLATQQSVTNIAWTLRTLLEDRFMKDQQQDAQFLSVRLEVVRLKQQDMAPGGVAESPSPRP